MKSDLKDLIDSCHLIDNLVLRHEIDLDKHTVRELKRLSRKLEQNYLSNR